MRKAILVAGLVGGVMVAGLVTGAAQQGNQGQSEIQRGFEIAPVPLNLTGKNRSLVGIGSYLVNGPGDCIGCHTGPPPGRFLAGGNPFLGEPALINTDRYMAGGNLFGPFVSRNLTPDRDGHPAGLTWEQFEETIRLGTDLKALPPHVPDDPGLLQVMPWPELRHATDRDLKAIYEYLSTIPCIEGGPGNTEPRC
jgi:hypothetical protein